MAQVRIEYREDLNRSADIVNPGAYAQVAAKRQYGFEALKANDPEALLYTVWVELVGAQRAAKESFDEWLMIVQDMNIIEANGDGADPPPAETSTASSADSPPTLE